MAIFLHEENKKGEASFYHPYISTLPETVEGLPTNFNEKDLALLEGSPILENITSRQANIRYDYSLIAEGMPELAETLSFEEFKHWRSIIGSRVFGIDIKGEKTAAMIAFADMINHRCPKLSAWEYSDKNDSFELRSLGTISEGVEIFDSYGDKSSAKFFVNYGFLEEFQESAVYLFRLPANPPFISIYQSVISEYNSKLHKSLSTETSQLNLELELTQDYEKNTLIKSLRFLTIYTLAQQQATPNLDHIYTDLQDSILNHISHMPHDTHDTQAVKLIARIVADGISRIDPISTTHEIAVLARCRELCLDRLNSYSTDIDADVQMLNDRGVYSTFDSVDGMGDKLSYDQDICIRYRVSEKRLLSNTRDMIDNVIPLFKMTTKAIVELIDHHPYKNYREYIEASILPLIEHKR